MGVSIRTWIKYKRGGLIHHELSVKSHPGTVTDSLGAVRRAFPACTWSGRTRALPMPLAAAGSDS